MNEWVKETANRNEHIKESWWTIKGNRYYFLEHRFQPFTEKSIGWWYWSNYNHEDIGPFNTKEAAIAYLELTIT